MNDVTADIRSSEEWGLLLLLVISELIEHLAARQGTHEGGVTVG